MSRVVRFEPVPRHASPRTAEELAASYFVDEEERAAFVEFMRGKGGDQWLIADVFLEWIVLAWRAGWRASRGRSRW